MKPNRHFSSLQEEQKKLRGTIEEADEMIKSLDECICQLETGMTAVGKFIILPCLLSFYEWTKQFRPATELFIFPLPLELAAVEEKGFDDKPSLKSCQEGNLQ